MIIYERWASALGVNFDVYIYSLVPLGGKPIPVISSITGKDITITINDIQKSVSANLASDEVIENIRAKLLRHGFEEWTEEEIKYCDLECFRHSRFSLFVGLPSVE